MVEVNTGGLNRGRTAETYPSLAILRYFREYQVPALITADAHRARDLDGSYPAARTTLLAAEYTHQTILSGVTNGRPRWTPDRL